VRLFCTTGSDYCSREFQSLCAKKRIEHVELSGCDQNDVVTVKEKIYLQDPAVQSLCQVVRLDRDTDTILKQPEFVILRTVLAKLDYDALVIADYGKGVFEGLWGEELIDLITRLIRQEKIPSFVNSKTPRRWSECPATFFVCNRHEFYAAWPEQHWSMPPPGAEYLVITLGESGATLFDHPFSKQQLPRLHSPSLATEVRDVTGAGDAFLAGIVYETLSRRRGFPYTFTAEDLESIVIGGQTWAAHCVGQIGVGVPIGEQNE